MHYRTLVRIDCLAGLAGGVLVLGLRDTLAGWYRLPLDLLTFTGLANLLYAGFGLGLVLRPRRRRFLILLTGNAGWAVVCVALSAWWWTRASWLGLGHLLLEGTFVAILAAQEWRCRDQLPTR